MFKKNRSLTYQERHCLTQMKQFAAVGKEKAADVMKTEENNMRINLLSENSNYK